LTTIGAPEFCPSLRAATNLSGADLSEADTVLTISELSEALNAALAPMATLSAGEGESDATFAAIAEEILGTAVALGSIFIVSGEDPA